MGPKVKATVSGKAAAVKNPKEEEKEEVEEKRIRKLTEEEMAEQEMSEHESDIEGGTEESDIEGETEEELGDEDEETTAEEGESEPASKGPKKAQVVGKASGKGAAASNATFVVAPISSHDILVAAISSNEDKKGISINGIKKYLKEHHPDKDWDRVKLYVRKALLRGLENGTFIRPKNSENATGLAGRFKMIKEKAASKKNRNTSSDKPKKVKAVESKGTSKAAVAKPKKVPAKAASEKKTEKKPEKENKVAAKKVKEAPQPKGKAKETTTKAEPKKAGRQPPKSRS